MVILRNRQIFYFLSTDSTSRTDKQIPADDSRCSHTASIQGPDYHRSYSPEEFRALEEDWAREAWTVIRLIEVFRQEQLPSHVRARIMQVFVDRSLCGMEARFSFYEEMLRLRVNIKGTP